MTTTTPAATGPHMPQITVSGVTVRPTLIHYPHLNNVAERVRAGYEVVWYDHRDTFTTLAEARAYAARVATAWATATAEVAKITGDTDTYPDPSSASGDDDTE